MPLDVPCNAKEISLEIMTRMRLLAEAKKFLRYLVGKRSELEDLHTKDILMAKVILDIHSNYSRKEVISVPLFSLHKIHPIDRENALETTRRRMEVLELNKKALIEKGSLTCELLAHYLPSVSWIKVVEKRPGSFLAFEGNGRLAAMQKVFSVEDGLCVEVKRYQFRNPKKIIQSLDKIRALNGLLSRDA